MTKERSKNRRMLQGTVVSDKMDKTVVVKIEGMKKHAMYEKQYKATKKYKVHDPKNEYKVGDVVNIVETRPLSKDKYFRVAGKVGGTGHVQAGGSTTTNMSSTADTVGAADTGSGEVSTEANKEAA